MGFEPTISAGERPQTYALGRVATGIGFGVELHVINMRTGKSDPFHPYINSNNMTKTYVANAGFPGFTSTWFSSVLPHKLWSTVSPPNTAMMKEQ